MTKFEKMKQIVDELQPLKNEYHLLRIQITNTIRDKKYLSDELVNEYNAIIPKNKHTRRAVN